MFRCACRAPSATPKARSSAAEPSRREPGSGRAAGPGHRRRPFRARPDAPLPRPRGSAGGDRRRWRDGSEARPAKPDPVAITLDVMMPGIDGWSVLRALKNDPATAEIPVIMLTMVSDRSLGFSLGASDYLAKPIDRKNLHRALSRYAFPEPGEVMVVEDDPADPRAAGAPARGARPRGAHRRRRPRGPRHAAGRAAGPDPARPDAAAHGRLRVPARPAGRRAVEGHPRPGRHRQGPHRPTNATSWRGTPNW